MPQSHSWLQSTVLDLLLLIVVVSVLKGNWPVPGLAPCVARSSSAVTQVCRTAMSLCVRATIWGWGKAQVNTEVLRSMWAGMGCCHSTG